jgi:hypothetical protein
LGVAGFTGGDAAHEAGVIAEDAVGSAVVEKEDAVGMGEGFEFVAVAGVFGEGEEFGTESGGDEEDDAVGFGGDVEVVVIKAESAEEQDDEQRDETHAPIHKPWIMADGGGRASGIGTSGGDGREGEFGGEAEPRFEEILFGVESGDFLRQGTGSAGGENGEVGGSAGERDFDRGDGLVVGAVEGVGETEDGGEGGDAVLECGDEALKFVVGGFGRAFAVVTGDEGGDVDFGSIEVLPGVFTDHVGGEFVVVFAAGGLGPADVVEESGTFEEFPAAGRFIDLAAELVVDGEGEAGDVADVVRFDLEARDEGAGFGLEGGQAHERLPGRWWTRPKGVPLIQRTQAP